MPLFYIKIELLCVLSYAFLRLYVISYQDCNSPCFFQHSPLGTSDQYWHWYRRHIYWLETTLWKFKGLWEWGSLNI